ncbi:alpha-N-arabinofuranosidase [Actinoplanes sp. NBRC 101535]|uniref:arabinosylfuranosidase ArfA n=1 Tax=Actinoplanes sp. NBRC 101535 TaxID=3032196 RepID=UPI0024A4F23E|nr:alpha-N-arabinofuranosidase [Actinoplanes sp. NBRC 101535]GLY08511.1 alpha-N-arabinofuranosidase [Actinoplanes sp. NBRC 101535]
MGNDVVIADRSAAIGPINRRLFGAFVEHGGRGVYDGLYEPGHPLADADGFRTDVLDLVRELGVTTARYPGGNFVSGYRWEDGIGPRQARPRRLDLAWHSTETNQIGVDEFAAWCRRAELELIMAVNLGTRGIQEALDLLEYSNHPAGTTWSDQRMANGSVTPHGIRMWCLGNEMDGPWQIGQRSADDYGALAARTAAAMRMIDRNLELVACGSSWTGMPTFGEWERTVLEHCYESVDYISCHAYYQEKNGDLGSLLASSADMQHFIDTVTATADHVRSRKRSTKTINIAFDEWNIWYQDQQVRPDPADWPVAPRILEDVYTVADAVTVGSLLITLLKNCDRVTAASLAQLVNVIAPIMTEPGGPSWRQTTFFPFATTARLARGTAYHPAITTTTYETQRHGDAAHLDAVVTWAETEGAVLLVNRDQRGPRTIEIDLRSFAPSSVTEAVVLADEDPYAVNTLADPYRVSPRALKAVSLDGGRLTVVLPPTSWAAVAVR